MIQTDLTKQAPRAPEFKLGNYVHLARMIDKCRATIAGLNGEYHYNCPVDRYLLEFKNVNEDNFKAEVAKGLSDEELLVWFIANGTPKTDEEVIAWSKMMVESSPYTNPEKKEWFVGVCTPLKIDPATATLFDYLNADDKATFPSQ